MPTLISADLDVVARAIAAVRGAIEQACPGVLGIHIEGPFLNVARKGVHDPAKLRELDGARWACSARSGGGRTLVTLAPEMTKPQIIRQLDRGGHDGIRRSHQRQRMLRVVAALRMDSPASPTSSTPCRSSRPQAGHGRCRAR